MNNRQMTGSAQIVASFGALKNLTLKDAAHVDIPIMMRTMSVSGCGVDDNYVICILKVNNKN